MAINWYPGHMATARKTAGETMGKVDLVIEVLDARVPHSSCNPVFEKLRQQGRKPALKLLNKSDSADPEQTKAWLSYYNAQPGTKAIALCAKKPSDVRRLPQLCQSLVPDRGTPVQPLRLMILGIPNVGKSTLMNALLNRHVANVGDEPAVTKMQMLHQLGPGISLIDTPGMLWPGMTQYASYKLASTHSIGRAAYDDEDVAERLAGYLLRHYRSLVTQRYGELPADAEGHSLIQFIATSRSLAKKSGGADTARAATALINEFRSGVLGRITLETVDQFTAEEAALPPVADAPES